MINPWFSYIIEVIMGLAIIMGFYRLLKGPTASDRTAALDALTNITAALIAFFALISGRFIYMDITLVYAILSFLGVIAIARYIEGGI